MGYHIANRRIQNTRFAELVPSPGYDWLPVGMITPYMGTTAPDRWLICDGSQYDPSDLPELYAVNGAFHESHPEFRVPDLRGRVPLGQTRNADGTNPPDFPDMPGGAWDNPVCAIGLGQRWGDWRVGNHQHIITQSANGGDIIGVQPTGSGLQMRMVQAVAGNAPYPEGGLNTYPVPLASDPNHRYPHGLAYNLSPYAGVNFIVYAGRPTAGITPISSMPAVTTRMMIESRLAEADISEEEVKMLKEQLATLKESHAK